MWVWVLLVRMRAVRTSRVPKFSRRRGGLSRRERLHLDALARAVVMLRAGAVLVAREGGRGWAWWGRCERCQRERFLQWCHVHSVGSAPALRWEPDNAFAACAECHVFGRDAWHRNVSEAMAWLTEKRGSVVVERLALRKRTVRKTDPEAWRLWLEAEVRRVAPWAWERLFGEGSGA